MKRRQWLLTGGTVLGGVLGGIGIGASERAVDLSRRTRERGRVGGRGTGTPDGTETATGSGPTRTSYVGNGLGAVPGVRIDRPGPTVFDMEHPGSGPFTVRVLDAGGGQVEQLVNATGPWTGEVATGIEPGTYRLRVEADGPWSIDVLQYPLYEPGEFTNRWPIEREGDVPTVVGPVDATGPRTISVSGTSDSFNMLLIHDARGAILDVPVYETSPVEATVNVSIVEEVVWLGVIVEDGSFSLSVAPAGGGTTGGDGTTDGGGTSGGMTGDGTTTG